MPTQPTSAGLVPYRRRGTVPKTAWPTDRYAGAAYTNLTAISGVNDAFATIMHVPAAGSITGCSFATGTVTTGCTLDIRLETVDATTGDPTGTLVGTTTNASLTLNASDDNVILSVTFTSAASVAEGDVVAVVIKQPAASAGNFAVRTIVATPAQLFPYAARLVGATWTKSGAPVMVALNYDGTYYHQQGVPIFSGSAASAPAINNTTTNRQAGLRFTAREPWRVDGAWFYHANASGVDFDVHLWEGDTIVMSKSMDGNQLRAATGIVYIDFDSSYTLKVGVVYQIMFEPTTATSISSNTNICGSQAMLATYYGVTDTHYLVRTSAPAWGTAISSAIQCGILFDASGI